MQVCRANARGGRYMHPWLALARLGGAPQRPCRCRRCALVAAGGAALIGQTAAGGFTGLHYAASGGHLKAVEALCRAAPPGLVAAADDGGLTALDRARAAGHTAVCEALARAVGAS